MRSRILRRRSVTNQTLVKTVNTEATAVPVSRLAQTSLAHWSSRPYRALIMGEAGRARDGPPAWFLRRRTRCPARPVRTASDRATGRNFPGSARRPRLTLNARAGDEQRKGDP